MLLMLAKRAFFDLTKSDCVRYIMIATKWSNRKRGEVNALVRFDLENCQFGCLYLCFWFVLYSSAS